MIIFYMVVHDLMCDKDHKWPETRIRFKDSPADDGLGQHYQGAE